MSNTLMQVRGALDAIRYEEAEHLHNLVMQYKDHVVETVDGSYIQALDEVALLIDERLGNLLHRNEE